MFLDEAVLKARGECAKFLSSNHQTKAAQAEAFKTVLSSVTLVLSAANLASGMPKHEGMALEVYRAHRESGEICQVVKISITQNGKMVKEDYIGCCPDLCTVLAKQAYEVEPEPLLESGVDVKRMVDNIVNFLSDHTLSMLNLGSSVKN